MRGVPAWLSAQFPFKRRQAPVPLNIEIFAARDDFARPGWRKPAKHTAKRQHPKALQKLALRLS
jgi:hypothetical protein